MSTVISVVGRLRRETRAQGQHGPQTGTLSRNNLVTIVEVLERWLGCETAGHQSTSLIYIQARQSHTTVILGLDGGDRRKPGLQWLVSLNIQVQGETCLKN